ncbi:MAG: hypothetical protein QOD61_1265, partial [Solirubrobacteraceae bacterium]|nr:hypothetical protein [Solirubrobacteraceae bacterium]
MLTDELERKGLLAIAVVTVATGATQVLVPGAMLGPLRAQDT